MRGLRVLGEQEKNNMSEINNEYETHKQKVRCVNRLGHNKSNRSIMYTHRKQEIKCAVHALGYVRCTLAGFDGLATRTTVSRVIVLLIKRKGSVQNVFALIEYGNVTRELC